MVLAAFLKILFIDCVERGVGVREKRRFVVPLTCTFTVAS